MPDLVNLTIDDQKVAVPKGTLVIEAAKSVGINIPVFCYHEKLKSVGACRMCLVEMGMPRRNRDGTMATNPDGTPVIGFLPKPQTSCTTPVSEGMVVRTHSPAVIKAQKGILEFLLINHPLDCPVCDKGGECPLQDQTFEYGPGASRFAPADKQHFLKPIDLNERIALDRERCVMCFRCVRFQEEIAGDPQINVFERGARSEIGVVPGQVFDSNFSGNTIELCPVGALTSKEFRFRARAWEMINVPSVCSQCAVGCNLTLQVRSNQVLRILARDNDDVNDAWICDRGRFGYEYVNANRLTEPLVRRGDTQESHGWPAAQNALVLALRHVSKEYGPQAIGGVASPRLTNEDLYVFQKFMRGVLGSNNVDYRISSQPIVGAAMQGAINDLDAAQAVFVIGSDLFDELPILGLRLRKAAVYGQAKVVVAHPAKTKLAADAAAWLQHAPGAELVLVQALTRSVVDQGLAKANVSAPALDLEAVAGQVGVSRQAIDETAKLLADRTPSVIFYGPRLVESAQGPTILAALQTLATALGATLNGLVLEANAQGARDMGVMPDLLPGGRPVSDEAARQEMASLWGLPALPETPGLSGHEMLMAAADGKLKALYLVGVDPLAVANGDRSLAEQALAKLEVLVVQDTTLGVTSEMAHVLLPGFSFAEADGTYTNVEHRVQRLRPALLPAGEMRADWRVIYEIASEMAGADWGYTAAADVFAEIAKVVPAYTGLTYSKLGTAGARAV